MAYTARYRLSRAKDLRSRFVSGITDAWANCVCASRARSCHPGQSLNPRSPQPLRLAPLSCLARSKLARLTKQDASMRYRVPKNLEPAIRQMALREARSEQNAAARVLSLGLKASASTAEAVHAIDELRICASEISRQLESHLKDGAMDGELRSLFARLHTVVHDFTTCAAQARSRLAD
jgi:hypothetical protein